MVRIDQHAQAQLQGVRLQAGNGGDQRAYAGRDAHRRGQDVVDHQRRRGQQSRAVAQVFGGHGVRAATLRIGLDRLPVAEVDDDQQDDDRAAHGDDVVHASQAERNEQGERGLGTVCGGTQCIEAEDGNARDGADVLGAFLAGGQRPAEEQIENTSRECHAESISTFRKDTKGNRSTD